MSQKTLSLEEIKEALIAEEKESTIDPSFLICSGCGQQSPVFTKETDGEQWFSVHECD
tara:strand:+ start:216 stop:389 length:174 start_codon:yes stop_codon:yes gene_type:complete